jgi:hypothetical protein
VLAEEAPKVTDWMQAWGSVVGLVLSGLAALATWILLRHEIRVRREEQRDREATQARLIVGRATQLSRTEEADYETPNGVKRTTRSVASDRVRWVVTNHSAAPVFNLRVSVYSTTLNSGVEWPLWIDVLEGREDGVVEIDGLGASPEDLLRDRGFAALPDDDLYVEMIFTDSAGLHWERVGHNPPNRLLTWEDRKRRGHASRLGRRIRKVLRLRPTTARRRADGAPVGGGGQAAG